MPGVKPTKATYSDFMDFLQRRCNLQRREAEVFLRRVMRYSRQQHIDATDNILGGVFEESHNG